MSNDIIQESRIAVRGNKEEHSRFSYDSVSGLFKKDLKIPEYQRPYRWQPKHVKQLLDDIYRNWRSVSSYRIGTIILHSNSKSYDIVDGQQRTVTISLILHYLYLNVSSLRSRNLDLDFNLPMMSNAFPHLDSQNNIRLNFRAVDEWFKGKPLSDHELFYDFILYKCQVVVIILDDLSTAFQLFDSQNARGKALEPYDLLKAFHLREMQKDAAKKKESVVRWEAAVNEGLLDNLGKYIFRVRKWSRGERAGRFSKNDIHEFKGVNIKEASEYRYMRPFLVKDPSEDQSEFPFQITQPIVNGKMFFEMVDHYSKRYKKIFKSEGILRAFCNEYCNYKGHHRVGDTYVRELFEAILLFCDDKYGEQYLNEARTIFYKWAYTLRLKQSRVYYSSIDKYVEENNMFKKLDASYHIGQIQLPSTLIEEPVNFQIDEVQKLFTLNSYVR